MGSIVIVAGKQAIVGGVFRGVTVLPCDKKKMEKVGSMSEKVALLQRPVAPADRYVVSAVAQSCGWHTSGL